MTRTHDQRIRSPSLCPAELWAHYALLILITFSRATVKTEFKGVFLGFSVGNEKHRRKICNTVKPTPSGTPAGNEYTNQKRGGSQQFNTVPFQLILPRGHGNVLCYATDKQWWRIYTRLGGLVFILFLQLLISSVLFFPGIARIDIPRLPRKRRRQEA